MQHDLRAQAVADLLHYYFHGVVAAVRCGDQSADVDRGARHSRRGRRRVAAPMLESFPPQKRGAAMAVYGIGVVVAPIIRPTLGGWITDNYSWRWVFYINIPAGILAVLLSQAVVEDPPLSRTPGAVASIT